MNKEIEVQTKFEELLFSKYHNFERINKWRQIMWQKDGNLIVSLVFLSKKMKFCFFNVPDIELDKLQRWGSTIFSQNLEYDDGNAIDWNRISELIEVTIESQSN